jgi:hypothetical protein
MQQNLIRIHTNNLFMQLQLLLNKKEMLRGIFILIQEDIGRLSLLEISLKFQVVNLNKKNRNGELCGYKLMTGAVSFPFAFPESVLMKRAGYLKYNLWVTPYHPKYALRINKDLIIQGKNIHQETIQCKEWSKMGFPTGRPRIETFMILI